MSEDKHIEIEEEDLDRTVGGKRIRRAEAPQRLDVASRERFREYR